jgi:hypothetical protein
MALLTLTIACVVSAAAGVCIIGVPVELLMTALSTGAAYTGSVQWIAQQWPQRSLRNLMPEQGVFPLLAARLCTLSQRLFERDEEAFDIRVSPVLQAPVAEAGVGDPRAEPRETPEPDRIIGVDRRLEPMPRPDRALIVVPC